MSHWTVPAFLLLIGVLLLGACLSLARCAAGEEDRLSFHLNPQHSRCRPGDTPPLCHIRASCSAGWARKTGPPWSLSPAVLCAYLLFRRISRFFLAQCRSMVYNTI